MLGNKAIGIDGLKDTVIKKAQSDLTVVSKLTNAFNSWTETGRLPQYMTTARVIPLSKTSSPFPSKGDVRTISITPAITKLYEKVIYVKLLKEVQEKNLISKEQRGFIPGQGTITNI